jgi:hypothetical protein
MGHCAEMRDFLRNDPQALTFLDVAQLASPAFGIGYS